MARRHLTTVIACSVVTILLLASYLSYALARATMTTMAEKAGWENGAMVIQRQSINNTRYPHWHIAASAQLFPNENRTIAWRHCLQLTGKSIASYSNTENQLVGEPPYCALASPEW